jgi:AraC-like DNA-binding protein
VEASGNLGILFDTSTLDVLDRPELWSEAHRQIFFPIGVKFSVPVSSHGRIEGHRFGPLGAYRVVSDPSIVRRGRSAIVASDPEQFLVGLSLRGGCLIEQEGRAGLFDVGEMSSWHSSHPFTVTTRARFDLLLIVIPRGLLGPARDTICRNTARRLDMSSGIGLVAAPFFREMWKGLSTGGPAAGEEDLADAAIALVRGLHAGSVIPGPAMLSQIKAYVDEHLQESRLDPSSIARAHHISTRYLHKLFAGGGVSVSEWVRHRRLEACRRDLRDPARAHESISQVALRWGFSNPAHFSRTFREEYGCTPSELRSRW